MQTEIGLLPKDWKVDKLENHLIIKGRIGWKGLEISEYTKNGPFIVGGLQIRNNGVVWEECAHVTEERYKESPEIMLKEKDILMTKDGTIGKLAYIEELPSKATVASHIHVIRKKSEEVLPKFLFYFFRSPTFQSIVESKISGSVVPALIQRDINGTFFPIPPLAEQAAIAQILSNLDAKIQVNLQMNRTFEAIGQAVFKRWFVDFEFPNEEGKPYKSSGGKMVYNEVLDKEIPAGWHVKPIDEIADFLNGLALQKFPARDGEEYLPVIKIRELRQGITESSDKANLDVPQEYIVNDGDILFSWSGSLEVVIWGFGKGALNQHLFKVTSSKYPKWFVYYWTVHYLPEYRQIAAGKATTMGHIQRHHLTASQVTIPDSKTLERMDHLLAPILERISRIKIETRILSEIRDSLLPKLMSGKIRVPILKEKAEDHDV